MPKYVWTYQMRLKHMSVLIERWVFCTQGAFPAELVVVLSCISWLGNLHTAVHSLSFFYFCNLPSVIMCGIMLYKARMPASGSRGVQEETSSGKNIGIFSPFSHIVQFPWRLEPTLYFRVFLNHNAVVVAFYHSRLICVWPSGLMSPVFISGLFVNKMLRSLFKILFTLYFCSCVRAQVSFKE